MQKILLAMGVAALLFTGCGADEAPGPIPPADTGDSGADVTDPADAGADVAVPLDVTPPDVATLDGATDLVSPPSEERIFPDPEDEAASIYDPTVLRSYDIILSDENLAKLDADPAAEVYVQGAVVFDGVTYENVGVRYKGSAGAWIGCVAGSTPQNLWNFTGERTCPKLSWKISFNKYDPEGRFFGVKKLLFHAMNSDPSLMRERLGYWLFRQMGVAAPRVVHARVTINGKRLGLYANVEYIDGRFTRSRFADGKGNLYKEVWPTWSTFTGELTAERLLAGLRTNEDENPSVDRVLAFSDAMQGPSPARATTLSTWMDIANVAAFIAVDRAIGADDGSFHYYCNDFGCGNHNFYFYEEEKADQLWLIPWDLDNAFVVLNDVYKTPADQFLKIMSAWNDLDVPCKPHPGATGWTPWQLPPSCDPLFRTFAEHFSAEHAAAVDALLAGPMSQAVVDEHLAAWQAQVADTVKEVHALNPEEIDEDTWAWGLSDLKGRVAALRALATAAQND